ncbi:MAG: protein jag [Thermoleophilia bacterium]|nr:protein jag [Thermoleophilia bacterium]
MRASAEGKTVSDAFTKAIARLEQMAGAPIDKEEAEVIVISEGSKGFLGMGSTMAKVEVRLPVHEAPVEESASGNAPPGDEGAKPASSSEARERLTEFLEKIVKAFGLEGKVLISENENELAGKVDGPDLGLFIGRHGQTMDAIQYLANIIIYRQLGERKRIVIDAEDYRDRRAETLQALADRGAAEVMKGRSRYELKPMSAAERRIIHMHLQDRDGVETLSEGDEPYRRVVIVRAEC